MTQLKIILNKYWKFLYPELSTKALDLFITELVELKNTLPENKIEDILWYKNATVYSLYVDLFNKDFDGLSKKISYLKDFGVTCLWLLPVLESPMKDAGFDISDYKKIRPDLCGEKGETAFTEFIAEAHKNNIKVIFDIAINHTSNQHYWFKKSTLPEKNKYSDYYIWSDNDRGYGDCRLLFRGMCNSNWEKHEDRYYFHRFFEFQPDLNYRNPNVLLDMCRNFMFWMEKGVDGFRADAIPFLWKEEGTNCENLEGTHTIVKFFRTIIEYLKPNTLLLAEACQSPTEIVNYMNDGDECNSAYHFPLMSQIFNAITSETSQPIINILQPEITPTIPENCQWFTFLRCHDQLSLESVCISEEDRKLLHSKYCHNPDWDFMMGQGISARLSELFKFNPDKVLLAYSILLTLPGTPIIFYGDEFAKSNDLEFYKQQIQLTGHDDTRNLARGRVDWEKVNLALKKEKSIEFIVFNNLKKMIKARKEISAISLGDFEFIETKSDILSYTRKFGDDEFIVIQNLSANRSQISNSTVNNYELIIGSYELENKNYFIKGHHYLWLKKIN